MQLSRTDLNLGSSLFTFEPFLDHKAELSTLFRQKIEPTYGDQSQHLKKFETGSVKCEAVVHNKKIYGAIAYKAEQSGDLFRVENLFLKKRRYYKRDYPIQLLQRVAELASDYPSVEIHAADKRLTKLLKERGFSVEKDALKKRVLCSSSANLQNVLQKREESKKESPVRELEKPSEISQAVLGKRASSTREDQGAEAKKPRQESLQTANLTLSSPALARFNRQSSRRRELTLKKNYIHLIRNRLKTVEGRIATTVREYKEGDTIRFFYDYDPTDDVVCLITKIETFLSFKEMLKSCGFKKCIPNVVTFEQAVRAYDAIPTYAERAKKSGVAALHLQVIQK